MGPLLEAIADPANLAAAWAKVRANAGAAGVDGQSVAAFGADAEHQLAALRRRLLSAQRYVPPPTVADRVVQQATVVVIGPLFEERFLACSFGYRRARAPNRRCGGYGR